MDRFVVGFAFNYDKNEVLLVEKKRPAWQKGHLNGIGGKIEDNEEPITAMVRESFEETGLSLLWSYRGVMKGTNNDGSDFECHVFYAYDNLVRRFKQLEDELLGLYNVDDYHKYYPIIANLLYLIPFGISNDRHCFFTIKY